MKSWWRSIIAGWVISLDWTINDKLYHMMVADGLDTAKAGLAYLISMSHSLTYNSTVQILYTGV